MQAFRDAVESVPWHALEHAYGTAEDTPERLTALLNPETEGEAYRELRASLLHQGSVFSATRAAIPFFMKAAQAGSPLAIELLTVSALGDAHFIRCPTDVESAKRETFVDVLAHRDDLLALYQQTDSPVLERLLCFIPGTLPDVLDLTATDDVRLADALVAQGFSAARTGTRHHLDRTHELTGHDTVLVRLAAGICLVLSGALPTGAHSTLREYAVGGPHTGFFQSRERVALLESVGAPAEIIERERSTWYCESVWFTHPGAFLEALLAWSAGSVTVSA